MDSDYDSDEESQIQDLARLTAVIRADNAFMGESSRSSSYSVSVDSTSTKIRDSYSKIESALALNKVIDEKMQRLEKVLNNRLLECRRRLEVFKASSSEKREKPDRQPKFRYITCGRPYFRDKQNFPAPENADTVLMKQVGMYDLSMVSSVAGWTVKDKSHFLLVLLQMTRAIRTKQLESKIAQLKRDSKIAKAENLSKSVREVKREIAAIKKKSLEEIALGLEEEYDWDAIAVKLNRRHTAQEYESLWKLFLHPSINKTAWSKEEHMQLKRVASENNYQNWDKIAQELNTGRTGYQCFVYYRTNTSNTVTGQKWTKEEEVYLKRLIEFYREDDHIPWGKVAANMDNRTKVQVYNKYFTLIVKRKGRFLPEEDSVILTCVDKYGENFPKIATHLAGRSARQVQVRYSILKNRPTVSVVWTPEEDRKLVQIVSNSDSIVNYSSIAKFFPGKDRFNIRARYMTLEKWLKRHPFDDIADAPRRAARRLAHGQSTSDLNKAIQNLRSRIRNEVHIKRKSKVTAESTEKEIEDSIIATLVNESHREEARKKQELEEAIDDEVPEETKPNEHMNATNIHRVLIMLKAKLNKKTFEESCFKEKYPGLSVCSLPNKNGYKSYSKKVQADQTTRPDIWGQNPLTCTQYFFPPNYDLITGCRKLMNHVKNVMTKVDMSCPTFTLLEKNNVLVREQKRLLMVRFSTLFLWPMLLSSVGPNVNPLMPVISPKRKTLMVQQASHTWVQPLIREKVKQSDSINLEEEPESDKIAISSLYVGNDDFMYLPAD